MNPLEPKYPEFESEEERKEYEEAWKEFVEKRERFLTLEQKAFDRAYVKSMKRILNIP